MLVERGDVHDLFALPALNEHGAVAPVVDVKRDVVEGGVKLAAEAALARSLIRLFLLLKLVMTSHILRALLLFVVDAAVGIGCELLGFFGVRAPLVALGSCRVDIGDNSLEGGLLLLLGRSVDFEEGGLQLVHLGLLEPTKLGF